MIIPHETTLSFLIVKGRFGTVDECQTEQGVKQMISMDEQDVSLGALEQYEREVKRIPSLEDEEEAHLLQCLKRGENVKQVRDRLVAGYQSLVFALARRFKRHCRVMDVLDLVQ